MPFTDESFDLVVNQYGLIFYPDKQGGVDEAYRVLKPGGHFAFATWDRTTDMPLFRIPINDHTIPFFKGEDTSSFHVPFSLHDPQQLMDTMKKGRFIHNRVIFIKIPGSTDSFMDIINSFFLKGSLRQPVQDKNPNAVNSIATAMEKSLSNYFSIGLFEFVLKAWIAIGQK